MKKLLDGFVPPYPTVNVTNLASALRDAEKAHAQYEKRLGRQDADWPTFYASYLLRQHAVSIPSTTPFFDTPL
jgi:hypothetical protein